MLFRPLLHVGSGETAETRGTPAVLRRRSVDRDGERGQRFQVCWFVCRCARLQCWWMLLSLFSPFFRYKLELVGHGRKLTWEAKPRRYIFHRCTKLPFSPLYTCKFTLFTISFYLHFPLCFATPYPSLSFLSIHCSISSVICSNDCLIFETAMASHFGDNGNLAINVTIYKTLFYWHTPDICSHSNLCTMLVYTVALCLLNYFTVVVYVCSGSVLMRMRTQRSQGGGRSLGTRGAWHVR